MNAGNSMSLASNTSVNSTTEDPGIKSKGFLGNIIVMFILALMFNISALVMIIRSSKSHRWSAFYRLMVSLNITDLFGSITCFPVLLATYANNVEWQGGQQLCNYTGYMISFVVLSSAAIVGTMSLERFIGVWFPFFYNNPTAKERRTNILLGTVWVTVAFISLLPIIGFGEYVLQYPGTWCFYNFRAQNLADKIYAYMYSVFWILTILFTIIFNLVKLVLRRIRAQDKKKQYDKANRNEIYSIILLIIIVIVTATCGIPMAIRAIVNESGSMKDNSADLHASRMATFNLVLDPLVYIFFRRENLECLFRFIRKRHGRSEKSPEQCNSTSTKTDNKATSASNQEKIEISSST
ncbi:prostaglandin E2 receptor EP4 subtype-like [Saccostrea echinata]|uniref:prostaglandin E2 receptor EP4 subtype-like n=1 Tax=Saccostrea echinata TaxID=191078 RepID=UPI002A800F36|nr:prostaglandin E2 receptor EP4 subtype-like [Saccostrea echinata]